MGGLSSGMGIGSLILIIIGVIFTLIALVLLIMNQNSSTAQPWYVWVLLFAGIAAIVIGGIMVAFAVKDNKSDEAKQKLMQK